MSFRNSWVCLWEDVHSFISMAVPEGIHYASCRTLILAQMFLAVIFWAHNPCAIQVPASSYTLSALLAAALPNLDSPKGVSLQGATYLGSSLARRSRSLPGKFCPGLKGLGLDNPNGLNTVTQTFWKQWGRSLIRNHQLSTCGEERALIAP